MDKLKPCPFCTGKNITIEPVITWDGKKNITAAYKLKHNRNHCKVELDAPTKQILIDIWNEASNPNKGKAE